jgi:hypothetical protein
MINKDMRAAVKMAARHRNTIAEALAIWDSMDDFDDPGNVMEQMIETLRTGLKEKFKADDRVVTLETGKQWVIVDIQYVHNRYQLKDVSGWQYGIDNLQHALDYWVDFAIENYRDEDVGRYAKAGLIELEGSKPHEQG